MKILHVADLHANQPWLDWVASHCHDFDFVVIAGDLLNIFSNTSMHAQARAIGKWLLSLTRPTVVCSGNHDYWTGDPRVTTDVFAEAGWLIMLRGKQNIVGVDRDIIEFRGLRVAVNAWLQVPDMTRPVDIILTHAPPTGCPCAGSHGQDFGDQSLWDAVRYDPPRLILSGHVHEPRKLWCRWSPVGDSTLVLVPGCDHEAEVPAHWVIDNGTGIASHSNGTRVRLGHGLLDA